MLFSATHLHGQTVINTLAGNGSAAYTGDGTAATAASLNNPYGVAVDLNSNVYVADYGNSVIRKIDTFGVITTIAGTGTVGFAGDGGAATAALLNHPRGICTDAAGNVYFSDYGNLRIRKISTSGIISTIAGTGFATFSGDGGPATAAAINYAWGLCVDAAGNMYIADQDNCRVRKINTAGIISTITGNGSCFISGDGGPAVAARVQYPLGVACDAAGNLYIADNGNNRIRKIDAAGIITTVAGSPTYGFSGDGGPSTAAKLYYPEAVATDIAGNVYISDINNSRIRMINTSGIINTIIGNGTDGFSGDAGPPLLAEINRSTGIAVGPDGRIYISDNDNNRIRVVHVPSHAPYFVRGHLQTDTLCPVDFISIDTMLEVFDRDTGQTESWSMVHAPSHGVLNATYSTTSTGGLLIPFGLTYAPLGYIGTDTFSVRIFDGLFSDTTTFVVTILPPPNAGVITGLDTVCPGQTVTLSDTVAGGTWTSSSTSLATVDAGGVVTGVNAGGVTVTYSVTNMCGTALAYFSLNVSSNCHTGITNLERNEGGLTIFPNPGGGMLTARLQAGTQEHIVYTITDIMGKVILQREGNTNEPTSISLDAPEGIYFCSVSTSQGRYVTKIVIVK